MFAGALLVFGCAKMGAPTGGPKDTTPPEVVEMAPANGSVYFTGTSFELEFDEYIKLKEIGKRLIVSPPFEEAPEVQLRGKKVVVQLPDSLKPNTTYSFNFDKAIADNNEGNELPSFVYAFSTGEMIDSMPISGRLTDARTLEPVSNAMIALYINKTDSMFRRHVPDYITRSRDDGSFRFKYLADTTYAIYALMDANNNLYFDQPNESIAFSDSMVATRVIRDSLNDSVMQLRYLPDNIELFMFEEEHGAQFVSSSKRLKPYYVEILFEKANEELSWNFTESQEKNNYYSEINPNKDSLKIWFLKEPHYTADSLSLMMNYHSQTDSLGMIRDTLVLTWLEAQDTTALMIESNMKNHSLDLFKDLILTAGTPLSLLADTADICLKKRITDSTMKKIPVMPDDIKQKSRRQIVLDVAWQEGAEYILHVDSAAFKDVYGRVNDSVKIAFVRRKEAEYTKLAINVSTLPQGIFELLLNDETISAKRPEQGSVVFDYLEAGTYRLRMFEDTDKDGEWDTGALDIKKQAEKVRYYPSEIKLRTNWHKEIEWKLQKPEDEESSDN